MSPEIAIRDRGQTFMENDLFKMKFWCRPLILVVCLLLNACGTEFSMKDSDADRTYKQCLSDLEARELKAAERSVRLLLKARPHEARTHYCASVLAVKKLDYKAAVEEAAQALKLDGKNADAYSERAFAYMQLGKCELALDDINAAISLDSPSGLNFIRRGMIELRLHKYAEAVSDFNNSEQIAPKDFPFYLQLYRAQSYLGLGQYQLAICDFNAAVKLMPVNNAVALMGRAICEMKVNNCEAAKRDCQELLNKYPDEPRILNLMGLICLFCGDKSVALTTLEKAAGLGGKTGNHPEFDIYNDQCVLPAGALAGMYVDKGKPELAASLLAKIQSERPLEANEQFQYGRALLARHQDEQAIAWLKTSIANDPDNLPARLELIRCYKQKGLRWQAAETQREALLAAKTAQDRAAISAAFH